MQFSCVNLENRKQVRNLCSSKMARNLQVMSQALLLVCSSRLVAREGGSGVPGRMLAKLDIGHGVVINMWSATYRACF